MRGAPLDPYRAPARRERVPGTSRPIPLWVLWLTLLAPYLLLLLGIPTLRVFLPLFPSWGGVREAFVCFGAGLAGTGAQAALLIPTAWLVERIVRALRSDVGAFGRLPLKTGIVSVYLGGGLELLTCCGFLSKTHPAVVGFEKLVVPIFFAAAVPLLFVWLGLVLLRRRGHRRELT